MINIFEIIRDYINKYKDYKYILYIYKLYKMLMKYFIGVIVLILTYVFFSNFILGYKIDKKLNPIIVHGSDRISSLTNNPYSGGKITRSEDKRTGIEFSYTTWLQINDNIDDTKVYNVFLKGSMQNDSFQPSQCPGVWLKKNKDGDKGVNNIELIINFDTFVVKDQNRPCSGLNEDCNDDLHRHCDNNKEYESQCNDLSKDEDKDKCEEKIECEWKENIAPVESKCINTCSNKLKETIKLHNIPYKRWFHLAIIVRNKEIDIYINGNLYDTFKLKGVIKQNHNDLLFGFTNSTNNQSLNSSIISDFRYFNYAIPYYRLDNLLRNSKNDLKVPIKEEDEFKPYMNRKYWTQENTNPDTYQMETQIA
jgi:hypothetical protein